MEPAGTAPRAWAVNLCREAGFEPDVRYESSDVVLHTRLVEAGHAAPFLPDLIWGGRRPPVPVRPLPRAHAYRRLVTAVRRGRTGDPALEAVRSVLLDVVPRVPGHGHTGSAGGA